MTDTPSLRLPLIAAAQSQKHVTHNDALMALDALVQLSVVSRLVAAPPASPAEGERWIVGPAASGAWTGRENAIALWRDGAWQFVTPATGWSAHVQADHGLVAWTGSQWLPVASPLPAAIQNIEKLGLGTTADAGNPLSAKLNNALWIGRGTGEGGDGNLRYKLSKEASSNTLSLVFQTNYSGRAEIGLSGDDDLRVKVSPDGSAWREALRIDRASGRAFFPSGIAGTADGTGFRNRLMNGAFAVNQRLAATSADDSYVHDRWYVLTQTGAIAAATIADHEMGAPTALRLTQSQATAQRFGAAQIIESLNIRDLRYQQATLSGRVKASNALTLQFAVLEHAGTADSVVSDVVANWTSTGFTPGDFFVSGLSVVGLGSVALAAGTWTSLPPLTVGFADVNNALVLVWTLGTVPQNATLDISRMQLEPGDVATAFEAVPLPLELQRCQRYYEKSYNLSAAPGAATTAGAVGGLTSTDGSTARGLGLPLRVPKRVTPTISYWDTAGNASRHSAHSVPSGFTANQTGSAIAAIGENGFILTGTGPCQFIHFTAVAEL